MGELLSEHLIFGTGYHLHAGDVPRDRNLLVADAALKDGVLAFRNFDVRQRLRKLKLRNMANALH